MRVQNVMLEESCYRMSSIILQHHNLIAKILCLVIHELKIHLLYGNA